MYLKNIIIGFIAFFLVSSAYAVAYQIFPGLNYNNPAALSNIKRGQIIVGNTTLFINRHFTGSAGPQIGTATSRTTSYLPYGRLAERISPRVVVGIDITQPGFADYRFPINSVLATNTTNTIIEIRNITPRMSVQLTKQLAWGLGFDISNLFRTELSFLIPSRGELVNTGKNIAYGWDTGFLYMPKKGTAISLIYYSKILHHVTGGQSTLGSVSSNSLRATIPLPAVYILGLTQFLSPKLAVTANVRHAQWDILRFLVLQNTAIGKITIPLHYRNGWGIQIGAQYQVADLWRILGGISFDNNIVSTAYRGPGLAVYSVLVPSVGAEYALNKQLNLKLIYFHGFSKPTLNTPGLTGPVIGNINTHSNGLDLSLTWNI